MLIEAALHLARQRHTALVNDDVDGYAVADIEMALLCTRMAATDVDALSPADIAGLDEWLALEMASLRLLDRLSSDVAGRLASLAAHGRANSAYIRSERSSVNPL